MRIRPECLRLIAWLCLVAAASAQEQTRRDIVAEVRVQHADVMPADHDYVLSHVSVRPGQFAAQADLSRDTRNLLDTGRFSDVRVLLERSGDGLIVTYVVKRRPRFTPPLTVLGNKAVRLSRVRDWIDLQEGTYIDEAFLAARAAKVRDEYRKRHFPAAMVSAELGPVTSNGLATATFRIQEGPKTRTTAFRFEGNQALSDDTLRAAVQQPSPWNPLRVFRKKRFDSQELEDLRGLVAAAYLDRGYLDAQVSTARLERVSGTRQVGVFTIHEGRLYRLSSVRVHGVTLFPTGEVARAAASLRPGEPAGRAAVQAASRQVRDFFGSRGYVDTTVRTTYEAADGDGTVAVRFDVREGVLAHVRSISIRGNTRTRDKVIRREIALEPGEILDEVQAERSRRRLENLGYFESVRYFDVPVPGNPSERDVVYDVREKNTGQFMVGAGFSSVDKVIGFAEVTQSNFDIFNWPYFHGGGQKARASMELGSTRKSVDVSLTEPWFLDRRLSLTVEGYRRELSYREYDERRMGGGTGLTWPLVVGRANLKYNFEQVRLLDVEEGDFRLVDDPEQIYRFTDEDDQYRNAPLRLSWLYDTRNRPFVPTQGLQASLFGEVTGPMTGADNEIYSVGGQVRRWQPLWFGHVLSLRVRGESVDAYGDQEEVNIADRLFLGGGRTLRGFEYRDVGPKALPVEGQSGRSYHPVGGKTMAMASAEYTVPVFKVLRLAAFYDIGNVWSESFEADFDEYASSTGVGLRFDVPGFPIRLDYAVPLKHDDDFTDDQRWVIWIGLE